MFTFLLEMGLPFTCGQWSYAKVQQFVKCNLHGSDFFKTLSVGLTLGFNLWSFALQARSLSFCQLDSNWLGL